ncbi:MAG: hypothetical protein GTO40_21950 [Deltaproteobacteria bacterium]|nr:hypothetical protein [Deltaproteobacteria bacterium]
MAIQIVVDGYNLIGSQRGLRGDLEGKRYRLIERLQKYRETKGFDVTLVFDGWRSGWPTEIQKQTGGITIIFSQQGEKADEVIKKLAKQFGSSCVVVTSDREVRRAAEGSSAVAIYAGEFNAVLRRVNDGSREADDDFYFDDIDEGQVRPNKKGNPHKLSKIERRRQEVLKKL